MVVEPLKSIIEFVKRVFMGDKRIPPVIIGGKRTSTITRHELELGEDTRRFLDHLFKSDTSTGQKLDAILTAINNLDGKVNTMSSNIDRIEKEAADAAENVGLVRAAVDGLNTIISDLKTEVAALKEQVAQGQLDQARLDAAATTLEKADDDIDAIVLPGTPAPAPEG